MANQGEFTINVADLAKEIATIKETVEAVGTTTDIAGSVWDELSANHVVADTFGSYITVLNNKLGIPTNIFAGQASTISDGFHDLKTHIDNSTGDITTLLSDPVTGLGALETKIGSINITAPSADSTDVVYTSDVVGSKADTIAGNSLVSLTKQIQNSIGTITVLGTSGSATLGGNLVDVAYSIYSIDQYLGGSATGGTIMGTLQSIVSSIGTPVVTVSDDIAAISTQINNAVGSAVQTGTILGEISATNIDVEAVQTILGTPNELTLGSQNTTIAGNLIDIYQLLFSTDDDVAQIFSSTGRLESYIGTPSDFASGASVSGNLIDIRAQTTGIWTDVATIFDAVTGTNGNLAIRSDIINIDTKLGTPLNFGGGTDISSNLNDINSHLVSGQYGLAVIEQLVRTIEGQGNQVVTINSTDNTRSSSVIGNKDDTDTGNSIVSLIKQLQASSSGMPSSIWDEQVSGHQVADTFGFYINDIFWNSHLAVDALKGLNGEVHSLETIHGVVGTLGDAASDAADSASLVGLSRQTLVNIASAVDTINTSTQNSLNAVLGIVGTLGDNLSPIALDADEANFKVSLAGTDSIDNLTIAHVIGNKFDTASDTGDQASLVALSRKIIAILGQGPGGYDISTVVNGLSNTSLVPLADDTVNGFSRDVIGNKDDTVAGNSLVALAKQTQATLATVGATSVIAGSVWDQVMLDHITTGTTGDYLEYTATQAEACQSILVDATNGLVAVSTKTDSIRTETNTLWNDWTDGGRLDLILDSVQADIITVALAVNDISAVIGTPVSSIATDIANVQSTVTGISSAQAGIVNNVGSILTNIGVPTVDSTGNNFSNEVIGNKTDAASSDGTASIVALLRHAIGLGSAFRVVATTNPALAQGDTQQLTIGSFSNAELSSLRITKSTSTSTDYTIRIYTSSSRTPATMIFEGRSDTGADQFVNLYNLVYASSSGPGFFVDVVNTTDTGSTDFTVEIVGKKLSDILM